MSRKPSEVSRTLASSSTISDAATVEKVRQSIRAEFERGLRKLGINSDLHLGSSAASATSDTSTRPHTLIDLVTSSAIPSMSAPVIIFNSSVSVANTASHLGNGGKA